MRIENYSKIKEALSSSPAGESLKSIYRWSGNGFRNSQSDKEWSRIMGATAQDFTHGELMYHIARDFCEREYVFTPRQERIFLFGVIVHDWGEAIIDKNSIGDISAQIKTKANEKQEGVVFREVIKKIKIDRRTRRELLNGYIQTVESGDHVLNYAFKALEKTEYVITAMKAYQNCKRHGIELPTLAPLVGRVLTIDLTSILDNHAEKYPYSIGLLFKNSQKLIDEMYEFSRPWLIANMEWYGKAVDHPALAVAFEEKWNNFKTKNHISQSTSLLGI